MFQLRSGVVTVWPVVTPKPNREKRGFGLVAVALNSTCPPISLA